MRNRAIKAASLVIAFVGAIIALFGVLVLLALLTDPPDDGGLVGFIIVLILISLLLGATILVGGIKLFASTGKSTKERILTDSHTSQQLKSDSDTPSRATAAFNRDTETASPEMRAIYCPNCGTESKESANFCRDCGQALSAEEETTHDSGLVSATKSQESSDTLAGYMSAKIQQMEAGVEAAPSSSPSSKSDATKKTGGESEGDAGKNQKKADSQPKVGSGYKKESEPTNRDKLLGCAVIGAIILVALVLIGSCGDPSGSDVEEVEAVVPIHGLIDHHDRYNGKRVKVRGHVASIGWEVWGGYQPGLSDFVLLGPLGGPHPNYAAFCRVDRSHVAEFRGLRQGQAVIVRGRYRYEEGTRPVELEDCRRVSE